MADDFYQLQREVEDLQREYNQMEGQFQQLRKQARKEFGCHKLAEAEKLLDKIHKEMIDIAELYTKKKKVYQLRLKKVKRRLR